MSPSIDISETHKEIVQAILREHLTNSCHIWVFGSRATWLAKAYSDLDLAIARKDGSALSLTVTSALETAFEDSLLPWKVDVIDLHSVSEEFRAAIERDKVLFSLGVGGEWTSSKLGNLSSFIKRGISPKYCENKGVLVLNQRCIRNQKVSINVARRHDHIQKKISADKLLKDGDVLINSTGVGTLGRVAQFKSIKEQVTVDTHVTIVRLSNKTIDLSFFGHLLRFKQPIFESLGEGSTGQTELSHHRIEAIEVTYPQSKTEQKAIAHILGTLDDKIELNRQTNQTLEAMAQALFQSWFVDFDPVIDKALAAGNEIPEAFQAKAAARQTLGDQRLALPEDVTALFPDAFVFTEEMGWVPEGWEVGNITNIVQTISETYPLKNVEKIIFLNTGDILDGEFLHRSYSDVSTLPGQAKKSIQKGDILFSEIRPKNKRFAYVNFNAENYVVSTKLMVLRTNKKFSPLFSYFILKQSKTIDILQKAAESRSGTFPQITFNELAAINLAIPTNHNLINFYIKNFLTSYFEQFFKLNTQSKTLTTIRDTLLPKLISGELRVADAGGFLGEVGI